VDQCKPLEEGLHHSVPGGQQRLEQRHDAVRAVHVDPTNPTLKAPGTERLKLKYDDLRSILQKNAFNFNMRLYYAAVRDGVRPRAAPHRGGRGLHSSTFRLNVSTLYGICVVHGFPPVY